MSKFIFKENRLPGESCEKFQISYFLTHSRAEAEQLFRLMCFNVFSHNYDDHAKNFSWLCDEGEWHLAPAYDFMYSGTTADLIDGLERRARRAASKDGPEGRPRISGSKDTRAEALANGASEKPHAPHMECRVLVRKSKLTKCCGRL